MCIHLLNFKDLQPPVFKRRPTTPSFQTQTHYPQFSNQTDASEHVYFIDNSYSILLAAASTMRRIQTAKFGFAAETQFAPTTTSVSTILVHTCTYRGNCKTKNFSRIPESEILPRQLQASENEITPMSKIKTKFINIYE